MNDETEIRELLEKLYANIGSKRFSKQMINISVSLGCSYYCPDEINGWLLSGMLRASDCSLYEVKENGRKNFKIEKFDPEKVYVKKKPE